MTPAALLLGLLACHGPKDGAPPGDSDPPVPDSTAADTAPAGPDADGDGFVAPEDCDDADASIYPGASDAWYDGVDSDCDSADDYDADGDGAAATAFGGGDCDDASPTRHPGAERVCGNDVDDDCDLQPDCDLRGELAFEDVIAGQVTVAPGGGVSNADVGDVDGDGAVDVVLGSLREHGAWLMLGPLLDVREEGSAAAALLGQQITLGDFDGDGLDDVATTYTPLFGVPLSQVWSSAGVLAGDAPVARLLYEGEGEEQSQILRTDAVDVNDDGFEDLYVAGFPHCDGVPDALGASGCARVYYGPFVGDIDLGDVGTDIVSPAYDLPGANGGPGWAGVHGGDDLTGDGSPDLVIPADVGFPIYYVVEGPLPPTVWLDPDVSVTMLPMWPDDNMEVIRPTAGDFDGDGHADLVTGAFGPSSSHIGAAWVFRGPLTGPLTDEDAWATAAGIQPFSVAAPGDMDGDGAADLAVTSRASHPVTEEAFYHTLLYYAPSGGVEPDATLTFADGENDTLYVLPLGDVDGDGLADLLAAGGMPDSTGVGCGGAVTLLGLPTGW